MPLRLPWGTLSSGESTPDSLRDRFLAGLAGRMERGGFSGQGRSQPADRRACAAHAGPLHRRRLCAPGDIGRARSSRASRRHEADGVASDPDAEGRTARPGVAPDGKARRSDPPDGEETRRRPRRGRHRACPGCSSGASPPGSSPRRAARSSRSPVVGDRKAPVKRIGERDRT
jgi:hypothetical protein